MTPTAMRCTKLPASSKGLATVHSHVQYTGVTSENYHPGPIDAWLSRQRLPRSAAVSTTAHHTIDTCTATKAAASGRFPRPARFQAYLEILKALPGWQNSGGKEGSARVVPARCHMVGWNSKPAAGSKARTA